MYLGQPLPSGTDDEAAAGWGGDSLAVYARGQDVAVIWWTTWDSDTEAEQAYGAARAVSPKNSKARVERKGRAVLIVRGLPAKLHRTVRNDFTSFARSIKSKPAPPDLRPSLIY